MGLGWAWGDMALRPSGWNLQKFCELKGKWRDQIGSPGLWVQGFCVRHSLLQGWQACPVLPYPQGPSAGPASFPRKLGGSVLWDLEAAELQVHLWWVTEQRFTTALLRHPSAILCACLTLHFFGGKMAGLEHRMKFCIVLKRGRRKIKNLLQLLFLFLLTYRER